MNVHRTFISYADTVEADRAALAELDGGAGMLTTGLSPTGLPPATAYISAGMVDTDFSVSARGITTLVVSLDDPYTVMSELGLQLVREPTEPPVAKKRKRK